MVLWCVPFPMVPCISDFMMYTRFQILSTAKSKIMPIYFIGSEGGPVKIGYCKDHNGIKIRMRGLQSASPQQLKILATIEGGLEKERELHKQFAAERLKGEWFKSDKKLLDYIGSLPLQMQRKRGRPRTGRNPQPLIACRL